MIQTLQLNRPSPSDRLGRALALFEEIGQQVLHRSQATVQGSNSSAMPTASSAIAIQTKILDRIDRVVQHETVERLAESGAISQAVAIEIDRG